MPLPSLPGGPLAAGGLGDRGWSSVPPQEDLVCLHGHSMDVPANFGNRQPGWPAPLRVLHLLAAGKVRSRHPWVRVWGSLGPPVDLCEAGHQVETLRFRRSSAAGVSAFCGQGRRAP